jgi:Fe-S-cluster containining protein
MSRQERRIKLKQSMDAVARRGVDLSANMNDQQWAVIAATRVLVDVLDSRNPARAGNAAKRAHELFETSLKTNPSKQAIACAKGCAFCCHVSVTATAPEVFLVANALREKYKDDFQTIVYRVQAADQKTRMLSSMERAQKRVPCALLEDNACSIYTSRPGACRGFVSTSAKACERGFNGEYNVQIDTPSEWIALRSAQKQALLAALAASDLPNRCYEFHHALRIALETPDAEARWLKGEDIFKNVAYERIEDPAAEAHNQQIIATLVAGALGKEMV